MLDTGFEEVVYSQTERIGLPNWSFVGIMASAKAVVPRDGAAAPASAPDMVYDYFAAVTERILMARCDIIARALNIWSGTEALAPAEERPVDLNAIAFYDFAELTFSIKETVGLPEKSSIDLLASKKSTCQAGTELPMFEYLSDRVGKQMLQKRDWVLANPRPWTVTR